MATGDLKSGGPWGLELTITHVIESYGDPYYHGNFHCNVTTVRGILRILVRLFQTQKAMEDPWNRLCLSMSPLTSLVKTIFKQITEGICVPAYVCACVTHMPKCAGVLVPVTLL